ncbi:MAG: 30S ribosomal protein S7 [Candidatus Parcubacteria bacterium]|nr:30S ribosomal protein S7 [Candidatus Parcubacteria bacterium]
MRRKLKHKRLVKPDTTYKSVRLEKFVNYLMYDGKKETARKVVNDAMLAVKEKAKTEDPLEVFEMAMKNAGPVMEVRSRRIGGANYQVPREVRAERRLSLAMRWILGAARSKKGSPMANRLADELISASKNEGEAIKKRDNTHKMADSNKAFAHFSW